MFLYIFLISIFFLSGLILTPVFGQTNNEQSQALNFSELACQATDGPSLKKCINDIRNSDIPSIRITAPIKCASSAECGFIFKDFHQQVDIAPSNPNNKIIRTGNFDYPLFELINSSNIRFKNLVIEDRSETPCLIGTECPALFQITDSTNLVLENLFFSTTLGTSLLINNSDFITVTGSSFKNSRRNALEVYSDRTTRNIHITDNLFEDNSGQGIIFQTSSESQNPSLISGNKLVNNHSGDVYPEDCNYPCIASQIKIAGPTANLNLTGNTISGGDASVFDNLGFFVSGIEVDNQTISGIQLSCNEIYNNPGSAVVQSGEGLLIPSPLRPLPGGITISRNKIWNNGLGINTPASPPANDNCYEQNCVISCISPGNN